LRGEPAIFGEETMTTDFLNDCLATMDFEVSWEHGGVRHTDRRHAPRVNFWRDILPRGLIEQIADRPGPQRATLALPPGAALPPRREALVLRVARGDLERRVIDGVELEPRFGRFYPRGILHRVAGVFRDNVEPFRCTELDAQGLTADLNHPLAGRPLALSVAVRGLRPKFEEHGGTSVDWLEEALAGPGMQARVDGRPTDFFSGRPFERRDERDDREFYRAPRLVQHLDAEARRVVSELYGRLVQPGAAVLDLMGSWTSHLPAACAPGSLTVLGLNGEELAANPRATARVVHDLNRCPRMPFPEAVFDAVLCTVSVEYLTRPFEVFAEVARVLRPGGVFAATFSNRWFPPKAIRLWTELHEFERLGLVLEYFRESGQYTKLESFSMRGLPRPEDDPYTGRIPHADPVYAVWGIRG
jgi:FKBP-type peptidyl-prolyl cis-trans isomerase 2